MSTIDFSDPAVIAALTDALTTAGVDGLEISGPGQHLRIVVSQSGGAAGVASRQEAKPPKAALVAIKAPITGRFHVTRSAEDLPRPVQAEDVVGFVRIGSILLPVSAGRSGQLARQLVEPDTLVGFGDPLFEIEAKP